MSENTHHHAAQYAELPTEERQIEASLALAYEQRTANLLAYRALANTILLSGTPLTVEFAKQVDSIDKQIIERMGL